jgi:hypothetical protein
MAIGTIAIDTVGAVGRGAVGVSVGIAVGFGGVTSSTHDCD